MTLTLALFGQRASGRMSSQRSTVVRLAGVPTCVLSMTRCGTRVKPYFMRCQRTILNARPGDGAQARRRGNECEERHRLRSGALPLFLGCFMLWAWLDA